MNRISKEKRNHLVLVGIGTVAVIAAIWGLVIRAQKETLHALAGKKEATENKIAQILHADKNKDQILEDLKVNARILEIQEDDMAAGDLYLSMYNAIRRFKTSYRVDIPDFKSVNSAENVTILPGFPYKQVTTSISGTAYYNELGRFVADYENRFPSARIQNLDLIPSSSASPEDREKLSFKLEIVSLVKPGGPNPTGTR